MMKCFVKSLSHYLHLSTKTTSIYYEKLVLLKVTKAFYNCRVIPTINVWEGISLKDIAFAAGVPLDQLINKVKINNKADEIYNKNEITELVEYLGMTPIFKSKNINEYINEDVEARPRCPLLETHLRPPVVAVLGHVDHGKTTLLDSLRSSRVVDEEFGGITQHIGAFTVSLSDVLSNSGSELSTLNNDLISGNITFIDTPGHAAFSSIRARSAIVTDIMLLVVAADDGVKPQTLEAIKFAKMSETPIVVAINKMDKSGISVNDVVQQLATCGIVTEQLGGDVQAVPISALKRSNLSGLMEAILLQAELMQIRCDPTGLAEAVVLESKNEPGIGKTATCLVTRGLLKKSPKGGPLLSGEALCTPRILLDDTGKSIDAVSPGFVAKVAGWKELPTAGLTVLEVKSINQANVVLRSRRNKRIQLKTIEDREAYDTWMDPYRKMYNAHIEDRSKTVGKKWFFKRCPDYSHVLDKDSGQLSINFLIKCDVQGSLEAIKSLLTTCPTDQCRIDFSLIGIGPLTESEVNTAVATKAHVLLFNVGALPKAAEIAKEKQIEFKEFNIIYRLAEEIHTIVSQSLSPIIVERVIGEAEILKLFEIKESKSRSIPVAGCRCTKGHLITHHNKLNTIFTDEDFALDDVISVNYRVLRSQTMNDHSNPSSVNAQTKNSENPSLNSALVLHDCVSCYSMRHEKSTVNHIRKGVECGLVLSSCNDQKDVNYNQLISDWQPGDMIQCYVTTREKPVFQWTFQTKDVSDSALE